MDTGTLDQAKGAARSTGAGASITPQELQKRLDHIKAHMPQTYELIVRKAGQQGNAVYRAVRLGCMGEPNRFWAMEAGHFAGTAFEMRSVQDEIAWSMVNFGSTFAVVFDMELDKLPPLPRAGGTNGAH